MGWLPDFTELGPSIYYISWVCIKTHIEVSSEKILVQLPQNTRIQGL